MTESLVARGRVVAVHANDAVTVECTTACPGCRCGRLLSAPTRRIELPLGRSRQCSVGCMLDISVAAGELLRGSLWLYGVPWLGFVLGTLLGAALAPTDRAASAGACVGLVIGVAAIKLLVRSAAEPRLEALGDA